LQDRFQRLVSEPDEKLAADACALREQLQQRATRSSEAVDSRRFDPAQLAALQAKCTLIDEFLMLGSVALPEDASDELEQIRARFARRLMGESMLGDLQDELNTHTQTARQLADDLKLLEQRAERQESYHQLLCTFEELLDSLLGITGDN